MSTVHEEKRVLPHGGATQNKERASKSFETAAVSAGGNKEVKTKTMKFLDILAATLLVAGGLNWGLIGLFQVDFVATVCGESQALSRLIYTAVGASAVYSVLQVVSLTAVKRRWQAATGQAGRP